MRIWLAPGLLFAWSAQAATVTVTTTSIAEKAVSVTQRYPATVDALQRTVVSAGLGAELLRVPVQVGDTVAAGQLVAELDCRDARLSRDRAQQALQGAEVALSFARRQADRIRQLAASNIASEELKDTRVTDVQRLEIGLATAQTALAETGLAVERCRVTAPFAAYVTGKYADQGTRVQVGAPIVELTSKAVDVQARIPLGAEWPENAVLVFRTEAGDAPLTRPLRAPTVDSQTGSRLVRLTTTQTLLPGTPGQLVVADVGQALPGDYLVERDGQLGLFVVDQQIARFIPRPAAALGQPVDVSDLPETTRLIDAGRFRVRDGDTLEFN